MRPEKIRVLSRIGGTQGEGARRHREGVGERSGKEGGEDLRRPDKRGCVLKGEDVLGKLSCSRNETPER